MFKQSRHQLSAKEGVYEVTKGGGDATQTIPRFEKLTVYGPFTSDRKQTYRYNNYETKIYWN